MTAGRRFAVAALVLVLMSAGGHAVPAEAAACTRSWALPVDGTWTDAARWSPAGVPGPTDDVCITLAGTYTVTLNGGRSIRSLTLGDAANAGVQTLWIQGTAAQAALLTSSSGITSWGSMRLESTGGAQASGLSLVSGVLTNWGTLEVSTGSGGSRQVSASLVNHGRVVLGTSTQFQKNLGVYTNDGVFAVTPGNLLTIIGLSQTFNQNGGTLSLGGLELTSATFNFNGGSIAGTPVLLNAALNIGPGSTGTASFSMRGSSPLSGDVAAGQRVLVHGTTASRAILTAATGFTNAGNITLESLSGTASVADLTVASGILTNLGTIDIQPGAGGFRTVSASLANRGTVNVNTRTTLSKQSGTYSNEGAFNVLPGSVLTIAGQSQVFNQSGGTLSAGGSFDGTSMSFAFNGGAVNGTPVLNNSALILGAGAGAGSFSLRGEIGNTLSGNISPAQTVRVNGTAATHAVLTAAAGFTNAGTIVLENLSGGPVSTLRVSAGVLTNTGTLIFSPGSGGLRKLEADLANEGTINVDADTILAKPGAVYTNRGTVNVSASPAAQTLNVLGGTFTQLPGGSLAGGGRIDLNDSDFFGAATIQVTARNNGRMNPGLSPGKLNVAGDYAQTTAGVLNIEIGGYVPGVGHDQLNVSGVATLAGTLDVRLVNGFRPQPCDRFQIVTYGSRSGTLGALSGMDLGGGLFLRPVYTAGDLSLVAVTSLQTINLSPSSLVLEEGGAPATYQVCLASRPTAAVVVTLVPDGQVTLSSPNLVFNPSNWEQVQSVMVTAVDHPTFVGPHTGMIGHTSRSADAAFDNLGLPTVAAQIADNQSPPPANRAPTASAGGPYAVAEGDSVLLTGSGSDLDGDALSFAWDLNNDGMFETAGQSVLFSAAGRGGPGSQVVAVQVCDGRASCAIDRVTISLVNAVPMVTATGAATNEGATATVAATFADPGALDTHSAVVGWGDGTSTSLPAVTSPFSATHIYGDNGVYPATVAVTDGDGGTGVATATITVTNVAPSLRLDRTGAISFPNGLLAFTGRVGVTQTHAAVAVDPGSDDLAFTWSLGPTRTIFNHGTISDLLPSPGGAFPFSATDSISASFAAPGVYSVTVGLRDDDGGSAFDGLPKVVTDNCACPVGRGSWGRQFAAGAKQKMPDPRLQLYLRIVGFVSGVFGPGDGVALTTSADARRVLEPPQQGSGGSRTGNRVPRPGQQGPSGSGSSSSGSNPSRRRPGLCPTGSAAGSGTGSGSGSGGSTGTGSGSRTGTHGTGRATAPGASPRERALSQTLAAWLNYARGAIDWGDLVDIDRDGRGDLTFGALIGQVEGVLKKANASEPDLERAASLARAANLHHRHGRDCDGGSGTASGSGSGTGSDTQTATMSRNTKRTASSRGTRGR